MIQSSGYEIDGLVNPEIIPYIESFFRKNTDVPTDILFAVCGLDAI